MDTIQWILLIGGFFLLLVPIFLSRKRRKP
jgi:LPXTG-motif cell wall-anchored protein